MFALVVFCLCAMGMALTTAEADPAQQDPDWEKVMKLLVLPLVFAALSFVLTGCTTHVAKPGQATEVTLKQEGPFRAQVVGVQWLNPLIWKDYSVEWNLLWTLGLSKANAGDRQVSAKPEKYSSVQPVASVVWGWDGRVTFRNFFRGYMRVVLRPIGRRYVGSLNSFYTVQPDSPKHWRELAGIHVEFAIPARPELDTDDAAQIVRDAIIKEFEIGGRPTLSSRNTPPDVRMTAGGANAGFTSLAAALDYLEAHPQETVWVMTWDVPDYPLDEEMTENCVILVLAGPDYDTRREALAWIARPVVRQVRDFEVQPGEPRAVQAWRAAMEAATAGAGRSVTDIGYLIHDAGKGRDASGNRLATLGQVLSGPLPEFNILTQGFNTTALLGDTGAGTALTNVALAIAYAHHRGVPVLVAGTTDAEAAHAALISPPARPRVFDPARTWFRARGEGNAYLPWWGLRKDVDWGRYMQGFSE